MRRSRRLACTAVAGELERHAIDLDGEGAEEAADRIERLMADGLLVI